MKKHELLISKGFKLNSYANSFQLYERIIKQTNPYIYHIASLFGYTEEDVQVIILQCDSSFDNCKFYCDGNCWDISTIDFFENISKI